MIQVFYNNRGSGKTKDLINLANDRVACCKGNLVYIDDDDRPLLELNRNIRFISTKDFQLTDYNSFYGFLCGILSEDYDVDTIFIDGLSNIVSGNIKDASRLFSELENLCEDRELNIFINVNSDNETLPDFMRKYVA